MNQHTKKIILANIFCSVFIFSFLSCATQKSVNTQNGSANAGSKDSKSYTFTMFDNCPEQTFALEAKVSLLATIPGYNGTYVYSFTHPSEKNDFSLKTYLEACSKIKFFMEKGLDRNVDLRFYLSDEVFDESTEIDFSSEKNALESIKNIIKEDSLTQEHKVYAFYKPI